MPKAKLTAKEKLFCYYFSRLQNHREALLKAGYPSENSEKTAAQLLQRRDICRQIARLYNDKESVRNKVRSGYERAAFGCAADVFRLLDSYHRGEPIHLEKLDLYNIAEIRDNGKGLEIKMIDRLKALEALAQLDDEDTREKAGAKPFYEALARSVKEIPQNKEDREDVDDRD